MKYVALVILCGILTGCAATQPSASVSTAPAQTLDSTGSHYYAPATAAALAFNPPIAANVPMPDLTREGRGPAAFAGYEQTVTSMSEVNQRDEIRYDNGRFERTAYSAMTTVISR